MMPSSMPIIKTKVLIPNVKDESIRRAKLTKKMKTISGYPLTIIHSGAGYGKSTALALFIKDEKKQYCWYSVSSADDDILPFLSYLISAIRCSFPNFGQELYQNMKNMDRYIREEEINMLCTLFVNELLSIGEELFMILDDFHEIEQSYTINRWMEILLEHIPANIHLIISSRSRPLWKQLAKMKVTNQLLEITKNDLMLTKDEAELLLSDYYHIKIEEEELDKIHMLTEGWVIAVGMFAQQIHGNKEMSRFDVQSSSIYDLFQYLALEVFTKQSPILQQFLEQTCIFEEFDEKICDAVLGLNRSETMLEQLIEKNLFIYRIGEKQYKYHALFKEFLVQQLKVGRPEIYRTLHERSARYFEQNKQWEQALFHYDKIQLTKAIASILNEYGFEMLESGKLESLFERLKTIPRQEKEKFYRLWFLQGEILRYRSLYKEAEECYNEAAAKASDQGDLFEKSRALEGKARIYLDTIQPHKAERILYEAIEIREKYKFDSPKEIGKLYHLLAENLLNSGQAAKAEKWIKRAISLNIPLINDNLQARLYLRTGRLEQAMKILENDHLQSKRGEKSTLPQSHRETGLLLALIKGFIGNGLEAKSLADEAIKQGVNMKAPYVEACGWMRMGHATQLININDHSLAEDCYVTALEMMEKLQVERGKAEPLMGLCVLFGRKGEYERAIDAGKAALVETDRVKDIWLSAFIQLSMGIAGIYNERLEIGMDYFHKSLALFIECGDKYGEMLSLFWQAYVHYLHHDNKNFHACVSLFLKTVQRAEYEFIFHKKTIFGPRDLQMFAPILIEAQKQKIMPSYVTKLLQEMNLISLDSHPGFTLRVKTFGRFQVWLGEKELDEKSWQRGKAKELFQFFITNHNKMISKEEIFQYLWRDQDEKSAARDFKVALNALNNALEPNRKVRANSFFIIREGSAYGLNSNAALELDRIFFEQWTNRGLEINEREQAINLLEKGLILYKGDYLPERKFADWCMNERERLALIFIRAAEKLAQLYVRGEEYDLAIHWCGKILEKDRTWEEAYRLMMYCYYRKNNRPFAIKCYQKCCETLEIELGVEPLEPTRHMYEMILEADSPRRI